MIGKQETDSVIALFPFLRDSFNVIDIGSNKGHWADIFISEFKERGRIILFEPNDMLLNYTRIKYEYQPNIWYENRVAYSVSGKKMPFFYFENYNNELSSIYRQKWEGLPMKEGEKQTISIDDYCAANSLDYIDYLKIDCEGADMDILNGCKKMMADKRIGIIQVEYSPHWEHAGATFEMMVELAAAKGYKIYKYEAANFHEVVTPSAHDNYYLTIYEIRNHSEGWNKEFILNTAWLPRMDLALEIGAFEGITTKYICENILKKLNENARVIVVDPLTDEYIPGDTDHPYFRHQYQRFLRNTRGLPVDLCRGGSKVELPKLHALRFDFIYIDGDHTGDMPYHDGCWAFAMCKPQGYILFDDYEWRPETKASIDRFLNEFSGLYDPIVKGYQVLIRKVTDKYNELTQDYY